MCGKYGAARVRRGRVDDEQCPVSRAGDFIRIFTPIYGTLMPVVRWLCLFAANRVAGDGRANRCSWHDDRHHVRRWWLHPARGPVRDGRPLHGPVMLFNSTRAIERASGTHKVSILIDFAYTARWPTSIVNLHSRF